MHALVDQIAALVHRRDAIQAERRRLDQEERDIEAKIVTMAGGGSAAEKVRRSPPPQRATRGRKARFSADALRLVKEQPGVSHGDLATKIYGEDTPDTRHKVRALLWTLKKQGKVRNSAHGGWEAAAESGNGVHAMT